MAAESVHPHRVRFLEELYSTFGDLGASGRSTDYLSRSLALPVQSIDQIAGALVADGLIRQAASSEGTGYVLTTKGAVHFGTRILTVSAHTLQRTLSATAIETLVSHAWRLRGPTLKTMLRTAFRTDRHPAFKRTTEHSLRHLLLTTINHFVPHTLPGLPQNFCTHHAAWTQTVHTSPRFFESMGFSKATQSLKNLWEPPASVGSILLTSTHVSRRLSDFRSS